MCIDFELEGRVLEYVEISTYYLLPLTSYLLLIGYWDVTYSLLPITNRIHSATYYLLPTTNKLVGGNLLPTTYW
jgi:hypothetical protein